MLLSLAGISTDLPPTVTVEEPLAHHEEENDKQKPKICVLSWCIAVRGSHRGSLQLVAQAVTSRTLYRRQNGTGTTTVGRSGHR